MAGAFGRIKEYSCRPSAMSAVSHALVTLRSIRLSQRISVPVVYVLASLAKYKYAPTSSIGSPSLPIGILSLQIFFVSGGTKLLISVLIYPGLIVFTLAN